MPKEDFEGVIAKAFAKHIVHIGDLNLDSSAADSLYQKVTHYKRFVSNFIYIYIYIFIF